MRRTSLVALLFFAAACADGEEILSGDIAVHDLGVTGGVLYWLGRVDSEHNNDTWSMPADGSTPPQRFPRVENTFARSRLVVTDAALYFAIAGASIDKSTLLGIDILTVVPNGATDSFDVTPSGIFFHGAGIEATDVHGDTRRTLAAFSDFPTFIRADDTCVYWAKWHEPLNRVCNLVAPSEPELVATGELAGIELVGGNAYWLDGTRIMTHPESGGTPKVHMDVGEVLVDLRGDDGGLYFATKTQIGAVFNGVLVKLADTIDARELTLDADFVYWVDAGKYNEEKCECYPNTAIRRLTRR